MHQFDRVSPPQPLQGVLCLGKESVLRLPAILGHVFRIVIGMLVTVPFEQLQIGTAVRFRLAGHEQASDQTSRRKSNSQGRAVLRSFIAVPHDRHNLKPQNPDRGHP